MEHLDFTWRPAEIQRVIRLWSEGVSLPEIAEMVRDRSEEAQLETAILVMDLARQGRIEIRQGGVYGATSLAGR
jgi:DNA-binding transcriptional MerR regulator